MKKPLIAVFDLFAVNYEMRVFVIANLREQGEAI